MQTQLKIYAKTALGSAFEQLLPGLVKEIDSGLRQDKYAKIKSWIVYSRIARAKRRGDEESLSTAHFDYWRGTEADSFYDRYASRYQEQFLTHHVVIMNELARVLGSGGPYSRLVEIGCGNGQIALYCRDNLPGLQTVIGLDINPAIVEENLKDPKFSKKVEFVCSEANEWLRANPSEGTVLLSYGGVLEYFSERSVATLLDALSTSRPSIFACVEPIDPFHDLETDKRSHPFGQEDSFSHNHRHILEECHYEVFYEKEMLLGGVRWMLICGERKAAPS